jgi:2-phosphosulfolactate phosphatase
MSKNIHITLTARDIREEQLIGKVAVVIDVLRATSVMITALANGARWVKAVASVDEALGLKSEGVLLGGERQALRIEGFDCSNSPLDYTPAVVSGKGIVLSTTNGTLAISKCRKAEELHAGGFINHQVLTGYLSAQSLPVELVCAGTNGEFSLDDFLCAGLICNTLNQSGGFVFDDLGRLAIHAWESGHSDIHTALARATHYNILKSKGFDLDLDYCLKQDTHNILVRRNPENRFVKWDGTPG